MSRGHSDGHVVSVIVPTLGRATLDQCRAALLRQTRPPDEVIVVVDEERRGCSWARNEGIRRARGDLLAFTDDDCVPSPQWLAALVGAVDARGAAGAGGTYVETDPMLQDLRARRPTPGEICVDPGGLVGIGGNVLYRREWLERVAREDGHVFNQAFLTGEDWELAWRLRRRGAELVFVPATVTHLRRVRAWGHCRQQLARGIGVAQLFLAHRAAGAPIAAQKSRIWNANGSRAGGLLSAAWHKGIGPFEAGRFRRRRHFWLFWLGEKVQAIGFAWGLVSLFRWAPVAKAALSAAILAVILRQVSFAAIGRALGAADPALIALAVAPVPAIAYLAALQMRIITRLQGLTLSVRQILAVNLASNFYGLFLPGAIAGGAVRWAQLTTADRKPVEALAAIVYNRLVDTFGVIAVGLAFWWADPIGRSRPLIAAASLALLGGLVALHLTLFNRRAAGAVDRWLGGGPRLVPDRVASRVRSLLTVAVRFDALPARGRLEVAGLCLVRHLLGVGSLYFFARALHLPLSAVNAGWVRSFVLLLGLLPISFAGLGVREGGLIAALQPYGVPAASAVALAVLMFARDLIGAAAGGLLEARRLFARKPVGRPAPRAAEAA